jgi:hypothetical protein
MWPGLALLAGGLLWAGVLLLARVALTPLFADLLFVLVAHFDPSS